MMIQLDANTTGHQCLRLNHPHHFTPGAFLFQLSEFFLFVTRNTGLYTPQFSLSYGLGTIKQDKDKLTKDISEEFT